MSELGRMAQGKQIEVTCPNCKRKTKVPAKMLFDGGTAKCPHCGLEFRSDGSGGREADKALNDLRRSLKTSG